MSQIELFNRPTFFCLFARQLAAMDEEIEDVNGSEPGPEACDRDWQRAEFECLRNHLEGNRGEEDATREAKCSRHQQGGRSAPERDQPPNGRG